MDHDSQSAIPVHDAQRSPIGLKNAKRRIAIVSSQKRIGDRIPCGTATETYSVPKSPFFQLTQYRPRSLHRVESIASGEAAAASNVVQYRRYTLCCKFKHGRHLSESADFRDCRNLTTQFTRHLPSAPDFLTKLTFKTAYPFDSPPSYYLTNASTNV
jgi:hypothetical protein